MAETQRIQFYAPNEVSENQLATPEGFLLCIGVPIARTGMQLYGENEVPVESDGGGLVRIDRDADEVFRSETIASFEGKPVTNDHPSDGVTPHNWKQLAVGVTQNVRRGLGIFDDFLFADLLITDIEAIEAVRDGKREVSCGYDADYEQLEPGRGRQLNIVGNHVALVDKGRCGSRCAIGDNDNRSLFMAKKKTVVDKILAAFRTRDAKALDEALKGFTNDEEGGEGESHIHLHMGGEGAGKDEAPSMEERMGNLEKVVKDWMEKSSAKDSEEEEEEERKKKAAEDAAESEEEEEEEEANEKKTSDSLKEIAHRAEILMPGFSMPTVDCKCKDKKKVRDNLTSVKRKALDLAYRTDDGQKAIEPFLDGKSADFAKLPAATIDAAFIGASELMRLKNNGAGMRTQVSAKDFGKAAKNPADLNKAAADFWSGRGKSN